MKIILLGLMLTALFIFSGCVGKEPPITKHVLNPCPKLQTFDEMNGSVLGVSLDIQEVNNTIQSMKAVRAGEYKGYWLTEKVQVRNLVFHVRDIKDRLFNSLKLNDLYKSQIQEYNSRYTKKGNRWHNKKE